MTAIDSHQLHGLSIHFSPKQMLMSLDSCYLGPETHPSLLCLNLYFWAQHHHHAMCVCVCVSSRQLWAEVMCPSQLLTRDSVLPSSLTFALSHTHILHWGRGRA